jgi:hypothetical protein
VTRTAFWEISLLKITFQNDIYDPKNCQVMLEFLIPELNIHFFDIGINVIQAKNPWIGSCILSKPNALQAFIPFRVTHNLV